MPDKQQASPVHYDENLVRKFNKLRYSRQLDPNHLLKSYRTFPELLIDVDPKLSEINKLVHCHRSFINKIYCLYEISMILWDFKKVFGEWSQETANGIDGLLEVLRKELDHALLTTKSHEAFTNLLQNISMEQSNYSKVSTDDRRVFNLYVDYLKQRLEKL